MHVPRLEYRPFFTQHIKHLNNISELEEVDFIVSKGVDTSLEGHFKAFTYLVSRWRKLARLKLIFKENFWLIDPSMMTQILTDFSAALMNAPMLKHLCISFFYDTSHKSLVDAISAFEQVVKGCEKFESVNIDINYGDKKNIK